MRPGHSTHARRLMPREVADRLLESLRPTRHLLARALADIPTGSPEYRQADRVVQELDGLARILIGDATQDRCHDPSAQGPAPERRNR